MGYVQIYRSGCKYTSSFGTLTEALDVRKMSNAWEMERGGRRRDRIDYGREWESERER